MKFPIYLLSVLMLAVLSAPVTVDAATTSPETAAIARLRATADSLHGIGRTDSAAVVATEAVRLAEKSGNQTQILGTHASLGVFLRSLGRIDEALQHYEAALHIATSEEFRRRPDTEAIEEAAALYINLSVLNLDMQDKDAAVRYAENAVEWCRKSPDTALKSNIMGVAGSVMMACGRMDLARKCQTEAYKYALQAGDEPAAFKSAAYAMLVSDRLDSPAEVSAWRDRCRKLLPRMQSIMDLLVYYQAECSICLKHNQHKEAIAHFEKILSLDGIDALPFVKFDCYNNMHLSYAALGDYRHAYEILLKSYDLRGKLMEDEKAESLRELTVKYESKEKELALAQSQSQLSRTIMWFFAAVSLLLVIVIVFIIYIGRQRRLRQLRDIAFARLRADTERQLTRQYVEGLENERERMSRELHDGVCNDLQAISMQLQGGDAPHDVSGWIDRCREEVRRISHELMPPEFTYATLDEVLRFLVYKYAEAHRESVSITYTSTAGGGTWTDIPDDVALVTYRIVQEALGNAVRHAAADNIRVKLTFDGSQLQANVSDDGTYRRSGRRGIGLDSMRRRAATVGGSVSVRPGSEQGTEVDLIVKMSSAGA